MASYPFHLTLIPTITLILLINSSMADNTTMTLDSDPRTFVPFGTTFQGQGYISIVLFSVNFTATPKINLTRIGFFLASSLLTPNNQSCLIDDQDLSPIVTFNDIPSVTDPSSSVRRTVEIRDRKSYYILYRNCVENTAVSLSALIDTYDLETKRYGDYVAKFFALLPKVMFASILLSGVLILIWGHCSYKNPRYVHMIQHLFVVFLALRFFKCVCGLGPQRPLPEIMNSKLGELSVLINFLYYGVGVALLFMPMTSLLKSCLRKREEEMLMILLVLQILADLLHTFKVTRSVKLYLEHPYDRFIDRWDYLYVVACVLICVVMVLLFVVVTSRLKRESINGHNGAKNLEKWKILMVMYLVFLLHQLILRISVLVFRMASDYNVWWMTLVVEHVVRFLFFVFLVYVFRPCLRNERSLWGNEHVPALPSHNGKIYPLQDHEGGQ